MGTTQVQQPNNDATNIPGAGNMGGRGMRFPQKKESGIIERGIQGIENLVNKGTDALKGATQSATQQKTNPNIPGAGNMGGQPTPKPSDLLGLNEQKPSDLMPQGFKSQELANVIPDLPGQSPSAVQGQQTPTPKSTKPMPNENEAGGATGEAMKGTPGTGMENPGQPPNQMGTDYNGLSSETPGAQQSDARALGPQPSQFWDDILGTAKMLGVGVGDVFNQLVPTLGNVLSNYGRAMLGQPTMSQIRAANAQAQLIQQRQLQNNLQLAAINQQWETARQTAYQEFSKAMDMANKNYEISHDRAMWEKEVNVAKMNLEATLAQIQSNQAIASAATTTSPTAGTTGPFGSNIGRNTGGNPQQ